MANTPIPFIKSQWFTDSGLIASGYKLYFYEAGTTTKVVTYNDDGNSNTNPVTLDSSGRANVFLAPGVSVKVVLASPTDTDPPTSPIWTVDNVDSIPASATTSDVIGQAGEAIAAFEAVYLSDGSGGTTAGRWYKTTTANAYSSVSASIVGIAPAAIGQGSFGTIRRAGSIDPWGSALTAGATYYLGSTAGSITSTAPAAGTPRRVIAVADSIVSLIVMGEAAKAVIRPRVVSATGSVSNGTTVETSVYSYTIPAGEIGTDGMSFRLHAWGTTVNNANVKTIRLKLAGTTVLTFVPTASEAGRWTMDATIIRSSASAARMAAQAQVGPANGPVSRTGTNIGTPAVTWANANDILVTLQGGASDDVTGEAFLVYQFD
jgi:hypothetical protein